MPLAEKNPQIRRRLLPDPDIVHAAPCPNPD